ncbi:hypothetical protein MTO96_009373 [Rhipicephalus appendiculatus]
MCRPQYSTNERFALMTPYDFATPSCGQWIARCDCDISLQNAEPERDCWKNSKGTNEAATMSEFRWPLSGCPLSYSDDLRESSMNHINYGNVRDSYRIRA